MISTKITFFLAVSLMAISVNAFAAEQVDAAQCLGTLTYQQFDDAPPRNTAQKIAQVHAFLRLKSDSDMEVVAETAGVFAKALEYTALIDDQSAFHYIQTAGQRSCDKVIAQ